MPSIGMFSGLASGIDFRSLVDQIMALEARPIQRLDDRIAETRARSDAFTRFRTLVDAFDQAAEPLRDGSAFGSRSTTISTPASGAILGASATPGAPLGSTSVKVLGLAAREKLAGADQPSRSEALGLTGAMVVNGVAVEVSADDALDDIAGRLNEAFIGVEGGVSASVLALGPDRYRMVLTADDSGAAGIDLVDPDGVLADLGFLDGTTGLKSATSDGALGDAFSSADLSVGGLRGLTAAPSGTVSIGGLDVALDLSTATLNTVAQAINDAADLDGTTSVSARVVQEEAADGSVAYRLDVSGTTDFVDADGVLEALGVLTGGRDAVTHTLTGSAALQQSGGAAATTGTYLTDLHLSDASAGVTVGHVFSFTGTRGDGTSFSVSHTVDVGDTVQTLLDRLNNATDGLGSGTRTATASLDGTGALVVTDGTAGDSRLSLDLTVSKTGEGALDFGTFGTTAPGRALVVQEGADAELEVDGVYVTRSSNTVTDVLEGISLTLRRADPDAVSVVEVDREASTPTGAMTKLVEAYNALQRFFDDQSVEDDGSGGGVLAGDITLRSMVTSIRRSMQEVLGGGTTGGLTRLGDIGITIQRDGTFELDQTVLSAALTSNPLAVERLMGITGTSSTSALQYVQSSDATASGTYAIQIDQAAERAAWTGTGFSGTYVDDGEPDTMTVRDLASGSVYEIDLADGMTTSDIVNALNAEFDSAQAERLISTEAFAVDGDETAAGPGATLDSLFGAGGSSLGIADGDTFTISGRRPDGTAFGDEFLVEDAATQTLGDLVAAIQAQVGTGVVVELDDTGRLVATDRETGSSLLELTVTSDNLGGGTLALGAFAQDRQGRSAAPITASVSGTDLHLAGDAFGSAEGFEVSYTAAGADGTGDLGFAADTYTGVDIAGTIGGTAATGVGSLLTADEGTSAEGLIVRYEGTGTGAVGDMTFTRGLASLLERAAQSLISADGGSIQSILDAGERTVARITDRIDDLEARLARREEMLLNRFIAMEQAIARSQSTTTALLNSLGAGVNYGGSSDN